MICLKSLILSKIIHSANHERGKKISECCNEISKLRNVPFFVDFFQVVSSSELSDSDVDDNDDDKSSLNLIEKSSP